MCIRDSLTTGQAAPAVEEALRTVVQTTHTLHIGGDAALVP